jgi:DNA-directed RNA polymerase specialized sigma24 family protein
MAVFIHKPAPSIGVKDFESSQIPNLTKLKSVYDRYSQQIYTLCVRLLANEREAETATIEVFVQLGKEVETQWDEPLLPSRLKELAIHASILRLRRRSKKIVRRLLRSVNTQMCRFRGLFNITRYKK